MKVRTEWGTAEMKKSVVFLLMLVAAIAMFAVACGGEMTAATRVARPPL